MRIASAADGIVLAGGRAVIGLRRARLALDDRVDELEVARVRDERNRDLAALRLADALGAEVVLHVARAALQVGRDGLEDALALELAQDRVDLAAHRMGEHVEPAAVRHAEHDAPRPVVGRQLDRLVEHRDHDVEPFDRKLLLPQEGSAQIALEALDVRQAAEKGLLLLGCERAPERAGLDRFAQPEPLLVARDVLQLERHRPAVRLAQDRQRLDQRLRLDVEAQDARRDAGHELGRQPRLEPVRVERGVAGRLRAERVEACGEMAVGAMRLDQGHPRRDSAEQQAVGRRFSLAGRHRRGGRRRAVSIGHAVGVELAQPPKQREVLEERLGVRLEERPPLRIHRLGSSEVVGEELLDEAGVQIVNLLAFHALEMRIATGTIRASVSG